MKSFFFRFSLITVLLLQFILVNSIAENALPKQISPLQNGDKVLFIGNSFTEWNGPLPEFIQQIIKASGSNLSVTFTLKTKGEGILKEYATWSKLGMIDEIRKGGWKYVVIQGWRDSQGWVSGYSDEAGNTLPNNVSWPASQDTMLKYFKVLDKEVRAVGATSILYAPHISILGWANNDYPYANITYNRLKDSVSCFYAPVVNSWDTIRNRYPSTIPITGCGIGSYGSFAQFMYNDCGHQNQNGIALDAATFYSIFTRKSAETLKPQFQLLMQNPDKYEEFAKIGYMVGKSILTMNNCGFTDTEPPSIPTNLTVKNLTSDNFYVSWNPSTDNIGVLGYKVYKSDVLVDTVAAQTIAFGGLTQSTEYRIKLQAFDSEGNISDFSQELIVNTPAKVDINYTGDLMSWDFKAVNGNNTVSTTNVVAGISMTSPSAVINTGTTLIANSFNTNALSMKNQIKTSLADAISTNAYFTFSIRPGLGNLISISKLQFRPFSQNVARNFTLMSNVAGFVVGHEIGTYNCPNIITSQSIQNYNITGHDSIPQNLEFRMYVWGTGTNKYESFGLGGNDLGVTANDLIISGNVVSPSNELFPTNLTASDLTETGFMLNWERAGGATLYEVFKDDVSVGTTTTTSMTISNVAIGNSYSMTVKSKTPSGFESELSTALDVKIPDLHNPTMPGNLTVNAISDYSFTLNWTAATDNVGVTLYEIFMDGKNYGNTGELNLPVPYLTPNTSYSMTVRAKDAAGNVSPFTEPIVVKTLSSTAIELPNSNPSMLIFPNPATDFVNINLTTPNSKITISVFDMLGKTVSKLDVLSQNNNFKFDISALKKRIISDSGIR